MRTSCLRWTAAVAVAASFVAAAAARGEDGIVRISDDLIHSADAAGCEHGACPTGVSPDGAYCPGCPEGVCGEPCPEGRCKCCGLLRRLVHKHFAGPHDHCCPLTAMMCHECTHSPDWGWNRPRHYPIHRVPVTYHQFWPTKWYGQPDSNFIAAYPMVYQPTDTTELGFYYQRVPYWIPKPWMLPPGPPWPAHWHHRDCLGPYDTIPVQ